MLLFEPQLARKQLLKAAGYQFLEGDVQHWWLPDTNAGVRTRISDDIVWLAYGIALYVNTTGNYTLLGTPINFIEGASSDRRITQFLLSTYTIFRGRHNL
ncbi:cellobiose phosphorylase [Bartonella callosciuri]|uniref:Cellobiose phosphorylase n=1 Tax=Bartonella callosciuri TaxID=686223 RepID=A0A840NX55_9HYPH|nr:cellobiose phosphorylase [Bartonella callosciuri]